MRCDVTPARRNCVCLCVYRRHVGSSPSSSTVQKHPDWRLVTRLIRLVFTSELTLGVWMLFVCLCSLCEPSDGLENLLLMTHSFARGGTRSTNKWIFEWLLNLLRCQADPFIWILFYFKNNMYCLLILSIGHHQQTKCRSENNFKKHN